MDMRQHHSELTFLIMIFFIGIASVSYLKRWSLRIEQTSFLNALSTYLKQS